MPNYINPVLPVWSLWTLVNGFLAMSNFHKQSARTDGGTIYDALLLATAANTGAEVIYTLNLKHFQTIAPPDLAAKLSAP